MERFEGRLICWKFNKFDLYLINSFAATILVVVGHNCGCALRSAFASLHTNVAAREKLDRDDNNDADAMGVGPSGCCVGQIP